MSTAVAWSSIAPVGSFGFSVPGRRGATVPTTETTNSGRSRLATAWDSGEGRPGVTPGPAGRTGSRGLAGLDAARSVVPASCAVRGVAPVALDLPRLAADRDRCRRERPRALVGVLSTAVVVPGVELRI